MAHILSQMADTDTWDKRKQYRKQYREQNKDAIAAKQKQYREQNKDDILVKEKQYREQNKDAISQYKKQYREQNKDAIAQYQEQNKDAIAAKQKQYREQNKDAIAQHKKQYREQNKDAIAQYQEQNKDAIAAKQKQYREQNKDAIAQYKKHYREQNKDAIAEYKKQYDQDKFKCQTKNCSTQATKPKYRGYCFRCFLHTYPDEEVPRNYKIKERHVQDYLTELFPKAFTYDKVIDGGCSRYRPDWLCDMLTHSIIVECDENQHGDYSCENKRMMTLFKDLGDRPIVFIRFNPDGYIDDNKKRHNSCFKYHQTLGTPIIANQKEWSKRLTILKDTIQYHMDNVPSKEVHLEHLFYNN